MGKFKKILSKEYVKWRYSNEITRKLVKTGMKIGFGMMCIITAIIFFMKL